MNKINIITKLIRIVNVSCYFYLPKRGIDFVSNNKSFKKSWKTKKQNNLSASRSVFLIYGSWTNKQVVGDQPERSPRLQRNPP